MLSDEESERTFKVNHISRTHTLQYKQSQKQHQQSEEEEELIHTEGLVFRDGRGGGGRCGVVQSSDGCMNTQMKT